MSDYYDPQRCAEMYEQGKRNREAKRAKLIAKLIKRCVKEGTIVMTNYRKRGCHDCLQYGSCGNPRADKDTDYSCSRWEWRYE